MKRCRFMTQISKNVMTPKKLTGWNLLLFHSDGPGYAHIHTHTLHSSQLDLLSANDTLMIMTMSNDNLFTTLKLSCSHFPPCGSRALSYQCRGCEHLKEKLQSDEQCSGEVMVTAVGEQLTPHTIYLNAFSF